jgi:hypothetical protein
VWLLLLISFPCFREAKLNYYYYYLITVQKFLKYGVVKFIGLRKCTRQERDNGRDTVVHRGFRERILVVFSYLNSKEICFLVKRFYYLFNAVVLWNQQHFFIFMDEKAEIK